MNEITSWILPLTFIPGVGMLVLSTASRFHNVNSLIREALSQTEDEPYVLSLYLRSAERECRESGRLRGTSE